MKIHVYTLMSYNALFLRNYVQKNVHKCNYFISLKDQLNGMIYDNITGEEIILIQVGNFQQKKMIIEYKT